MRPRVFSSLPIGNCTALMPRGPHAMPQRPIDVSNIAKECPVMAASYSVAPWCELDAGAEYGLGDCCFPPEFRDIDRVVPIWYAPAHRNCMPSQGRATLPGD